MPLSLEDENKLRELKLKRSQLKRQTTTFNTFLETVTPEKRSEIKTRLANFEPIFSKFEDLHIEILLIEETDEHYIYRDDFEDQYYKVLQKAHVTLGTNSQNNTHPPAIINHDTRVESHNLNVRMPKIELPSFNGAYDSWRCFYDTYKSMIHDKEHIPTIEKFFYLRSCLKGEAETLLQSFETTADNYTIAWDLLVERYDNKRVIVNKHLQGLLDQTSITKDNYTNMRQFLNNINTHTRALEALGLSIESWDAILIYLLTSKLDKATHQEWEKTNVGKELSTLKDFITFLKARCQILEATNSQASLTSNNTSKNTQNNTNSHNASSNKTKVLNITTQNDYVCPFCNAKHRLFMCQDFSNLPQSEKYNFIRKEELCLNCLRKGHLANSCTRSSCKKCDRKHHTLLHNDNKKTKSTQDEKTDKTDGIVNMHAKFNHSQVLLATAQIHIYDKFNKKHVIRVVLDGGSQAHFITDRVAKLLNLSLNNVNLPIQCLNETQAAVAHTIRTKICSRFDDYEKTLTFLVVTKITDPLPQQQINMQNLNIPKNISLADPFFYKSLKIDALIGAELYYKIFCAGQINLKNQDATLLKTKLGWIIGGRIQNVEKPIPITCNLSVNKLNLELINDISKFWELEEVPEIKFLSPEESQVEKHFSSTYTRDSQGRFIVKQPFNDKIKTLNSNYDSALKRFHNLENKFKRDPILKNEYEHFIHEYSTLQHMTISDREEQEYFLPHHAVFKETSATTKIRVVFDGSAKSPCGFSLNDTLKIGPTIQEDIFSLLTRARTHRYLLIADIKKMYRQILMDENERKFQKIIWRSNSNQPICIYNLNTVTYGLSSSSYLAIRSLHELAELEKDNFPMASKIIKRDFYVDDLLTGSNTLENATKLRDDINTLLSKGRFELRQWSSNEPKLVDSLPSEVKNIDLFNDPQKSIKTLGIQWNSQKDTFEFAICKDTETKYKITKRNMLSQTAQIFDPIGLLGPVIVRAKLIIQKLWQNKLDWDESVPLDLHTQWLEYRKQLPLLKSVSFDRFILLENPTNVQLHGFCDASEEAYGACMYIRSTDHNDQCIAKLLCAKSKVAPLKTKLSVPKLELCSALLLSRLYKTVKSSLPFTFDNINFWSDSTITLNWINTEPHRLKTFVANRVSKIRNNTDYTQWNHVPTQDNPADYISRGQSVDEFLTNNIWKFGPKWLTKEPLDWPCLSFKGEPLQEIKKTTVLKVTLQNPFKLPQVSSYNKLKHIVAYCWRFIEIKTKNRELKGPFSVSELERAEKSIVRIVQQISFSKEIDDLIRRKTINSKSSLNPLSPFIDENNILRVGGRLSNAPITNDQKHPILLPKQNHVTDLIIRHLHEKTKHAGIQATLNHIRSQFWPINGKATVKRIIHKYVICFRFSRHMNDYLMSNLPKNRTIPSRAFTNTGVDYCGPFFIKEKKHRNRGKVKVYVALFVCFSTKAIHLEVVSDLTTETFIGCLKRFFARRGKSKNIYSDNATNFVGANNELNRIFDFIKQNRDTLNQSLADEKIQWHFIPPNSPHFGGLWESGVKSFKHHFYRTIGNSLLTYEEFNTHVIEIEAILNSRPLTPLSTDPNDLTILTPAHFLIGDTLLSVPDVDFTNTPSNRLSNWQHIQKLKQYFWQRWQREYLNELNVRNKWTKEKPTNIRVGSMVLLKEDNASPLEWNLGRIVAVHPGDDDVIRVVSVTTKTGTYKRSVKKLAILPIET